MYIDTQNLGPPGSVRAPGKEDEFKLKTRYSGHLYSRWKHRAAQDVQITTYGNSVRKRQEQPPHRQKLSI